MATEFLKKVINLVNIFTVRRSLAADPLIFRSPPLTKKLVDAIRLISPHCDLVTNQESKLFWESDQNTACWGENQVLEKYFAHYPKPKKILEIGPGLGRSVVFLTKLYHLERSVFHLFEGNGTATKYTINGPRFDNSFCGATPELREVLRYNRIGNYRIFDAIKLGHKIDNLPEKYDMIYSFYAIGFHWNLKFFIHELLQVMNKNSVGFFIVPGNFRAFKQLKSLYYKMYSFDTSLPVDKNNKMLVISKHPLSM